MENRPPKAGVVGSNPAGRANKINELLNFSVVVFLWYGIGTEKSFELFVSKYISDVYELF